MGLLESFGKQLKELHKSYKDSKMDFKNKMKETLEKRWEKEIISIEIEDCVADIVRKVNKIIIEVKYLNKS